MWNRKALQLARKDAALWAARFNEAARKLEVMRVEHQDGAEKAGEVMSRTLIDHAQELEAARNQAADHLVELTKDIETVVENLKTWARDQWEEDQRRIAELETALVFRRNDDPEGYDWIVDSLAVGVDISTRNQWTLYDLNQDDYRLMSGDQETALQVLEVLRSKKAGERDVPAIPVAFRRRRWAPLTRSNVTIDKARLALRGHPAGSNHLRDHVSPFDEGGFAPWFYNVPFLTKASDITVNIADSGV